MTSPSSPPPPASASIAASGGGLPHGIGGQTAPGLTTTEPAIPPKAGLNRLRQGPKDTIPVNAKTPPRKQRSSRFHVTEKVELEKLPNFNEVVQGDRAELFVRKLRQCGVVFDFNDASSDLKGKQIKAQTLHEMLDYITGQRGVITEAVYPEVVNMVSSVATGK